MAADFETILCLLTAVLVTEAMARRLRIPPSAMLVAGRAVDRRVRLGRRLEAA